MTDMYVTLPLFEDPFYFYTITLEGNYYTLQFTFNERQQGYYLSLFDSDKNPIFQGVGLVPNYPIAFDYVVPELSGYFWMEEKGTLEVEHYKQYPQKLNQYYNFYYRYSV